MQCAFDTTQFTFTSSKSLQFWNLHKSNIFVKYIIQPRLLSDCLGCLCVVCVCISATNIYVYTQGFSLLTLMQFDFDFLQFRLLKKFTHSVAYFIIQVKDSRRNVTYSLLFQIWLKSRFLFCKTERVLDSFHIIFEIDSFTCIDCDIW